MGVDKSQIIVLHFRQESRVWRSLVARLNGVQEAAGSIPVTRTRQKALKTLEFSGLFAVIKWLVPEGQLLGSYPLTPRYTGSFETKLRPDQLIGLKYFCIPYDSRLDPLFVYLQSCRRGVPLRYWLRRQRLREEHGCTSQV